MLGDTSGAFGGLGDGAGPPEVFTPEDTDRALITKY